MHFANANDRICKYSTHTHTHTKNLNSVFRYTDDSSNRQICPNLLGKAGKLYANEENLSKNVINMFRWLSKTVFHVSVCINLHWHQKKNTHTHCQWIAQIPNTRGKKGTTTNDNLLKWKALARALIHMVTLMHSKLCSIFFEYCLDWISQCSMMNLIQYFVMFSFIMPNAYMRQCNS